MENQTWWDAVCNASRGDDHPISDKRVLSDAQYKFYKSLRDDPVHGHMACILSTTKEEQQLYICFMAAFHDEL